MSRPDFELIRRNSQTVFSGNGETAIIRQYVSGIAGTPKFGVADTLAYTETIITAMFASTLFGAPRPTERGYAGGQAQDASLMMTTDSPIGAQSEIIWRGTAYRVAGATMPQNIGGHVMYRNPLTLAARTG